MISEILYKIEKIINPVLQIAGLRLVKISSLDKKDKEIKIRRKLCDVYTKGQTFKNIKESAEIVIFSMDRPLQLHSLISSFYENIDVPLKLHILFRTTTEAYLEGYNEVFRLFKEKNLNVVKQNSKQDFKSKLINILKSIRTQHVVFLVDDIVFKNKLIAADLGKYDARNYILSLRLAPHLQRSYTMNVAQPAPSFADGIIEDKDKLCWIWKDAKLDWEYPLSVDGNVFLTQEILVIAQFTDFNTPNSFEGNLQLSREMFTKRFGICYKESKIINLPINKVNTDTDNLFGDVSQEFLLEQWNKGMQMDYKKLFGIKNISAHQEIPINFIQRKK